MKFFAPFLIFLIVTFSTGFAQDDSDSNSNESTDNVEEKREIDLDSKVDIPEYETDRETRAAFKDYELAGLKCHNKFRALHHDPAMHLDPKLNQIAQNYAVKLAKRKDRKLVHSHAKTYGENLSASYSKMSKVGYVEDACKRWYNESKDYSYKHPGFTSKTGHFTAMVWKSSTKLGIGVATVNGNTIVVANYQVFPNMANQFKSNVLPKSG